MDINEFYEKQQPKADYYLKKQYTGLGMMLFAEGYYQNKHKDILIKSKQMKLENKEMINGAKGHKSIDYYKAIDLGIDRIIKLIERNK